MIEKDHIQRIKALTIEIGRDITIMEICGGHTNTIMKYGLRDLLPPEIRLISGPGCPVCVSSQLDIDSIIEIARSGVHVATYGDMLRVPGSGSTLELVKTEYGTVHEVYSATDALKLSQNIKNVVFFGVGFETTAPMTAYLLQNNVRVFSVHKLVPPAIRALIDTGAKIDGFIDPGHVSTITGLEDYRNIKVAQAISGFTPERILRGVIVLLELIRKKSSRTVNAYPEAVSNTGNTQAQKLLKKQFKVVDSDWRGLGTIPNSGLDVKNDRLNARLIFKDIICNIKTKKTACRCADVLRGIIDPTACPLYRKTCSPENPVGACMVSDEGSCAIYYRYGK